MEASTSEKSCVKPTDPLEEALLIIQAELSKTLDARLRTLEAKVDIAIGHGDKIAEIHTAMIGAVTAVTELMESPTVKALLSSASGFPGFPSFGA